MRAGADAAVRVGTHRGEGGGYMWSQDAATALNALLPRAAVWTVFFFLHTCICMITLLQHAVRGWIFPFLFYVFTYIYIHTYICIYMIMHICTDIYVYIYTYIHIWSLCFRVLLLMDGSDTHARTLTRLARHDTEEWVMSHIRMVHTLVTWLVWQREFVTYMSSWCIWVLLQYDLSDFFYMTLVSRLIIAVYMYVYIQREFVTYRSSWCIWVSLHDPHV